MTYFRFGCKFHTNSMQEHINNLYYTNMNMSPLGITTFATHFQPLRQFVSEILVNKFELSSYFCESIFYFV